MFVLWPAPAIQLTRFQFIVSGAGESRSWPLWGVFEAPHCVLFFFSCPYELAAFEYSGLWQTALQRTQNNKGLNATRCSAVLLDGLSCYVSALPHIVALLAEGRASCLLVCHQSLQTDSQRGSNPGCQRATLRRLSIALCSSADLEVVKSTMNDNWANSSEQGS